VAVAVAVVLVERDAVVDLGGQPLTAWMLDLAQRLAE
jgi:hypothetical protein